ncbi:hypothetical protein D0B97_14050 [Vibrio cholerae]|nr:hypothetical protein [Vibrio cholerae]
MVKIIIQLLRTICVNGIGLIAGVFSANYQNASQAANFLLFFMLHQVITSISISGATNYIIKITSRQKITLNDYRYIQKLVYTTCLIFSLLFLIYFFYERQLQIGLEVYHLLGWLTLSFIMTGINVNYSIYQGLGEDFKALLFSFLVFIIFCMSAAVVYFFHFMIEVLVVFSLSFSMIILFFSVKNINLNVLERSHSHIHEEISNAFKLKDYILNFVSNSVVLPVFFFLGYAINMYGSVSDSLGYNITVQLRNLILLLPFVILQYSITQQKIFQRYFLFGFLFAIKLFFIVFLGFFLIKTISPFIYGDVFGVDYIYLKYMCVASFFAAISSCLGNFVFVKGDYKFCMTNNVIWALVVVFTFVYDNRFDIVSAYLSIVYGYVVSMFICVIYFSSDCVKKRRLN